MIKWLLIKMKVNGRLLKQREILKNENIAITFCEYIKYMNSCWND